MVLISLADYDDINCVEGIIPFRKSILVLVSLSMTALPFLGYVYYKAILICKKGFTI